MKLKTCVCWACVAASFAAEAVEIIKPEVGDVPTYSAADDEWRGTMVFNDAPHLPEAFRPLGQDFFEHEYELIPSTVTRPYALSVAANEFAGKNPRARAFDFAVDGAARFAGVSAFGLDGVLKIRIRATDPQTDAVEITFHQSDRKVWGCSSLPIGPDWNDVILPLAELKYFSHWGNLPPVQNGDRPDPKRLCSIRFCYGAWLCRGSLDKPHGFEVASVKLVRLSSGALGDGKDHSLDEFPRLAGETDDTARFRRAVAATPAGVLTVPRGEYLIASPIYVLNRCSLDLNKNAILRATRPMSCVLRIDGRLVGAARPHDYNVFFRGGVVDGDGLASCVNVRNFTHFTLRDCTFLNGRAYGLRVDGGCETMAENVYAKCVKPGLAGNSGFLVNGGDSHYTDCIVVDYTIGFNLKKGGSNRLTRCHVWGGLVPPPKPGELPEMLKGSINFKIDSDVAILRDCYADTGETGFLVSGWETRLLGCSYFNNPHFKLGSTTIIRHPRGRLLVADGSFVKTTPDCTVYEGCGEVEWRNMMYAGAGLGPNDDCPGALLFRKKSVQTQSAPVLAE